MKLLFLTLSLFALSHSTPLLRHLYASSCKGDISASSDCKFLNQTLHSSKAVLTLSTAKVCTDSFNQWPPLSVGKSLNLTCNEILGDASDFTTEYTGNAYRFCPVTGNAITDYSECRQQNRTQIILSPAMYTLAKADTGRYIGEFAKFLLFTIDIMKFIGMKQFGPVPGIIFQTLLGIKIMGTSKDYYYGPRESKDTLILKQLGEVAETLYEMENKLSHMEAAIQVSIYKSTMAVHRADLKSAFNVLNEYDREMDVNENGIYAECNPHAVHDPGYQYLSVMNELLTEDLLQEVAKSLEWSLNAYDDFLLLEMGRLAQAKVLMMTCAQYREPFSYSVHLKNAGIYAERLEIMLVRFREEMWMHSIGKHVKITVKALLNEKSQATDQEIAEYIGGVLTQKWGPIGNFTVVVYNAEDDAYQKGCELCAGDAPFGSFHFSVKKGKNVYVSWSKVAMGERFVDSEWMSRLFGRMLSDKYTHQTPKTIAGKAEWMQSVVPGAEFVNMFLSGDKVAVWSEDEAHVTLKHKSYTLVATALV